MIPKDPRTAHTEYKAFVDNAMRENAYRKLARELRRGRPRWYSRHVDWLLCEVDYRRVVLAERLARYEFTYSLLRGDEAHLFSAGSCR